MFQNLTDADYKNVFAATTAGICLFYKQLCPHCKNMEKVLEKFSARMDGVQIFTIDSEACPEAVQALQAERAPTLVIIKDGAVKTTKAGLMNPKELIALYENA